MGIVTGADYIESLRGRNLKVWFLGERIAEPVDHPVIRPSINAVARTYDLAVEHPELATAWSRISGRPVNRFLYEDCRDLIELAATYAVAISGNHPFIDGNKRVAFVALGQFLADNGLELVTTDDEAIRTMLSLAAGELDLPSLVIWLRTVVREAKV